MKTLVIAVVAACAAIGAYAQAPAKPAAASNKAASSQTAKKSMKDMTPEERKAHILARTGGKIAQPNTKRGRIVFLDTQSVLPESEIKAMLPAISKDGSYNYVITKGEYRPGLKFFADAKKEQKADILVAVINDPDAPVFLAAPEDGWAAINTGKLGAELKGDAKVKFLASRYRKELMRAFVYAVGTPQTQFPGNTIAAACAHDLDLCEEFVPVDAMQKTMFRLKDMGVMPERMVSYRRACMEGWAPSPTNDVQKKIWEQVHTLPDKPIKIEYDAKKGE